MKYLSVCSGIEAASVAWHPLGWTPLAFSEIEAFPRAVLAHHYPDVPLYGDFTKLRDEPFIADADVLVGGTPCQAFSVAGLRKSLDDDRGNLSLEFVRLADAIDDLRHAAGRQPAIIVWENVPGVLSVKDNAFGCFLAALAGDVTPYVPPRRKWTDAGVVIGPQRAVAWRILDAQYFGLAQRRRRVFVVASAREGFDPAAVLLEWEGVRRDSPPSREAGQIAPTIPARSLGGGGLGTDFDCDGGVIRDWPAAIAPTLNAHFGEKQGLEDQHIRGGGDCSFPAISQCLNAGGMGRRDWETETFIPTIGCVFDEVAHTLKAEGFDASEDGTGRGTPLVPVAFSSKDHGADATVDLSPTLRAMPHNESHANGGGQMAVAVPLQEVGKRTGVSTSDPRAGIGIGQDGDPMFTLQAGAQHGVAAYAFQPRIARNGRGDMGELVNALNAQSGETGKGDAAPCVAVINGDQINAYAEKTGPIEALRVLRDAIGEEAFTVWGFGILAAFQSPEILRSALHGCGLRYPSFSRSWMVGCSLGCAQHGPAWLLQSLRETGREGCPPQGWEPSEQLNRELGAYLSRLSQPGASAESLMHDLWCASEGAGVLRQALSTVQEMGQPALREGQPAHATMAVRRLTATECEFLQGFPRGYTAIPWRGKPAADCPDGPRYKALGNSMAVPVMRWIGKRIAEAVK